MSDIGFVLDGGEQLERTSFRGVRLMACGMASNPEAFCSPPQESAGRTVASRISEVEHDT